MKTVTSIENIRAAFPEVSFTAAHAILDSDRLGVECRSAHASAPFDASDTGAYELHGRFTGPQIQALAYWAQHPEEFVGPGQAQLRKLRIADPVRTAADVFDAFAGAEFDSDGITNPARSYLYCSTKGADGAPYLFLDGSFSRRQLLAMNYWVTHLDEWVGLTFPEPYREEFEAA